MDVFVLVPTDKSKDPFPCYHYQSSREEKGVHKIEHSHGWCGTCDDKAQPNSKIKHISEGWRSSKKDKKLLYQMNINKAKCLLHAVEMPLPPLSMENHFFLPVVACRTQTSHVSAPGYCGKGAAGTIVINFGYSSLYIEV